jgi:hypothetical protein
MPKRPSQWLQKQLNIPADERLSARRPIPEPEEVLPVVTGRQDWEEFIDRQVRSEKVKRQPGGETPKKKSAVRSDGKPFQTLYDRWKQKKENGEVVVQDDRPQSKTVWSDDPRWMKPRTVREPVDERQTTQSQIGQRSRELTRDKPSLLRRSQRDFKDMMQEFRAKTKDARLRAEYAQQFE